MNNIETIFLCATKYELDNIFRDFNLNIIESFPFQVYEINDKALIILTGVGKANAAAATQYAIKYNADSIMNIGLVGCLNPQYTRGKAFIISDCKNWDVDATAFKYKLGQIPGNGLVVYELNNKIKNVNMDMVSLISGDSFVIDAKVIQKSLNDYSPILIDMELASIAHVLNINNSTNKLSSIKAISDYVNDKSSDDFYTNDIDIFEELRHAVNALIA